MFILKYQAPENQRSTLRVSVSEEFIKSNEYKALYLPEINRFFNCQTIETMFANKLVAPLDRFKKHKKIAGRDIYDIHHFFTKGYTFRKEVIRERTKKSLDEFMHELISFIEGNITQTTINEDLNSLLPAEKFQKIKKTLKTETLALLRGISN